MQDGFVGNVGEADINEPNIAREGAKLDGAGGVSVLFALAHDLASTVKAGEGFSELRADGDELHDGGSHEGEHHDVGEIAAGGKLADAVEMRAHVHDERADDAEDDGGGERHEGLRGERTDDVLEEAVDTAGEDMGFALFGVIALDDADDRQAIR